MYSKNNSQARRPPDRAVMPRPAVLPDAATIAIIGAKIVGVIRKQLAQGKVRGGVSDAELRTAIAEAPNQSIYEAFRHFSSDPILRHSNGNYSDLGPALRIAMLASLEKS